MNAELCIADYFMYNKDGETWFNTPIFLRE